MSGSLRIEHSCPGRVRIKSSDPAFLSSHELGLREYLHRQTGVLNVRVNCRAASVVLDFEPGATEPQTLLERIRDFFSGGAGQPSPAPAEGEPGSESGSMLALGLSFLTLAFILLVGGPLVPVLLASSAVPVLARAASALFRERKVTVDVLDATAAAILLERRQFLTLATMVWLINLGEFIRDSTLRKSHRAIEGLFDGRLDKAWVLRNGRKYRIDVQDIVEGDELVAYCGEYITVDGAVTAGAATVDESTLTGESAPVSKSPSDAVYAGTVIQEGKLYIKAQKVGGNTRVRKIIHLVSTAPIRDTRIQNYARVYADRVAPWSLGGATGLYLFTGNIDSVTGLLVCDYGTGIRAAAPTTVLSSMVHAARCGIVIKGGRYLEKLAETDTIVFDKTGTLTHGRPELIEIVCYGSAKGPEEVLSLAAAAEQRFTHPMAVAIERAARTGNLPITERTDSTYTIGLGVKARVGDSTISVGCQRFMQSAGVSVDPAVKDAERIEAWAATPVFVARDGQLIALLALADPIRSEAAGVVNGLREHGIRQLALLTGDRAPVAARVASELGLTDYVAEASPEEKLGFVKRLQAEGHTVAVVGDGINDSPALAQADVGIAVRGGTDVAWESASVILLEADLWKIDQAIGLARDAVALVEQNWTVNWYANTAAIALTLSGRAGAVLATLISNGAGALTTLNGLRPLLDGRMPVRRSDASPVGAAPFQARYS